MHRSLLGLACGMLLAWSHGAANAEPFEVTVLRGSAAVRVSGTGDGRITEETIREDPTPPDPEAEADLAPEDEPEPEPNPEVVLLLVETPPGYAYVHSGIGFHPFSHRAGVGRRFSRPGVFPRPSLHPAPAGHVSRRGKMVSSGARLGTR